MEHLMSGGEEVFLLDYPRLRRRQQDLRPTWPAGPEVRTCRSCGRRIPVRLDPEGGWAWCTVCGRAA